ncbi:ABC transporter ATP-binding protein [Jeotgalibacillus proteolyticus]|uniref:ABC transporter domain-containing protein n=1 Tax=Jeotgalibacillus proteolyticus TaxID=2082395 RepID=A0A2S5GB76_9BACL|nr:ABC transporter ATP-binding protein [Jeotgalibacillus proteolyticus]PPA70287.1 hypothetical protein C4B60_11960 [Jeotgalibacillus proteolyticus]
MEYAVSVKSLSKKYKLYTDKWGPIKEVISKKKLHNEFLALNNISLDFPKGESIGVLGKNGSGKSTLLKIITGIAEPSNGNVDVRGSLVFLDVSSGIDAELSGYDNIFMKGTLLGYSREEMQEKLDDIIDFSELEEFIHQPVKNYSSGMRAKLGFAISVNVNPDILIVDEALAVGDSIFREKCMKKMNEFKEKGKTIIFVSHDKNAVESFCSKAAWIHKGQLVMYGESKEVCRDYQLFMSGKRSIESIKAEKTLINMVEEVKTEGQYNSKIRISGKLYENSTNSSEGSYRIKLINNRTRQHVTIPIERNRYNGEDSEIPKERLSTAGFTASVQLEEYSQFLLPDNYSFYIQLSQDGNWAEVPLSAGKEFSAVQLDSSLPKFRTEIITLNDQLSIKVENHKKLNEQVNKIWYEENYLCLEGVAYVKELETTKESDVSLNLILKNKETYESKSFKATMLYTKEITDNSSLNPEKKNYDYSHFSCKVCLDDLGEGELEAYFHFEHLSGAEIYASAWASLFQNYDTALREIGHKTAEVKTVSKYLTIELKKK